MSATPTPRPWHTPWTIETLNGRVPVVRERKMPHGEASTYYASVRLANGGLVRLDFGYGTKDDEAITRGMLLAVNLHDEARHALDLAHGYFASHANGDNEAAEHFRRIGDVLARMRT